MPIQELVQIKQSNDLEKNTAVMMAVNCAPVIKGSKASNLITVTMQEFYMIRKLVRGTGISYHLLKIKANKFMLFLYRREALKRYILSEKVQKFLRGYGYPADDFSAMLHRLFARVEQFSRGEIPYPHEMGAFLEYPIEDILGFMENDGENFSFYGYWKVYHNEQEMTQLFQRFDEEREHVLQEILEGKTIREIAV